VGPWGFLVRSAAAAAAALLLLAPAARAGDSSAAPTPLASGSAAGADTTGYGVEPGEPNTTEPFGQQCGSPWNVGVARTAWFSFQAAGGPVSLTTGGSDYDTAVFVYTPAGVVVACNDDTSDSNQQSAVSFSSAPGATYAIQIGRACNETGPPKCTDNPPAGHLSVTATQTTASGDLDGDGYVGPTLSGPDCNDTNAAIHPGATDALHNGVDEDCSGKDAPYPALPVDSSVSVSYAKRYTLVTQLRVTGAPAGARVTLSCASRRKGCRFTRKTVTVRSTKTLQLGSYLRRAKLRKSAKLTILVTKPGYIGASIGYTIRLRRLPAKTTRCVQPGSAKPQRTCS
jgi:Putative metal-binding motif